MIYPNVFYCCALLLLNSPGSQSKNSWLSWPNLFYLKACQQLLRINSNSWLSNRWPKFIIFSFSARLIPRPPPSIPSSPWYKVATAKHAAKNKSSFLIKSYLLKKGYTEKSVEVGCETAGCEATRAELDRCIYVTFAFFYQEYVILL